MIAERAKQQTENTRQTLNRGQEKKTKVIWLHLKIIRLSKDDSAVHSKRQKQKKQIEDEVGIKDKDWTEMDCASITGAAENRSRCKMIVVKSSVVPQRSCKVA